MAGKFKFKVQDINGKVLEGLEESRDKYTLAADLKKRGNVILSIEEVKGGIDLSNIDAMLSTVGLQDKITFTKNVSAMVEAGLPLARALSILVRQTKNPKFKNILESLEKSVTKGNTFSDALAEYPKVFSPLFIAMVRVGEESGKLPESLRSVGDHLERSYTLRKKVKGAMMYPSIVLLAMVVIGILMMIFVVPTLTAIFEDVEADLPKSTQFIIFISDFMAAHSVLVIGGFVTLLVGAWLFFTKTRPGKRTTDTIFVNLPLIGVIVKRYNMAQATRTLSSLLEAGVHVSEAFTFTAEVLQNHYYKEILESGVKKIQQGSPLAESFVINEKYFEPIVGGMIEVGEETGKLSDMLGQVATFYENEVQQATKDLSTIIEPILMIVIGTGVGFFAMAMITPMYSLVDAF